MKFSLRYLAFGVLGRASTGNDFDFVQLAPLDFAYRFTDRMTHLFRGFEKKKGIAAAKEI